MVLIFIVFVKCQHKIGQLLGFCQRNRVVKRGTYATHRSMALQLDHGLCFRFGQELLFQGIVTSGTTDPKRYVHSGAHIRIYGAVEEAFGLIDNVVDKLGLGSGLLLHAGYATIGLDPLENQAHYIDAERGNF